jgi:hypothetical protein
LIPRKTARELQLHWVSRHTFWVHSGVRDSEWADTSSERQLTCATRSQFPPPHYAIFFVTRFAGETESQFLQDAVGSVFLRQRKRKNPGPRLRVLHDLDQMTRHFCGKAATLKFWKSEIRDLDSDAPRRRAKCARADYRVGRKPDIYPRRIGACCFVKVGRLVANISRGVVQQSRPPLSPLHFLPIRTKGRRERFKAESQIRGRESRSRLLAWGN